MKETNPDPSLHSVILYTLNQEPLLEGELRRLAEHALKTLSSRYPGLKILRQAVHPDRVELKMDFGRLDEDVQRVVQSFKLEVKNLACRKNLSGENLWQWGYKED